MDILVRVEKVLWLATGLCAFSGGYDLFNLMISTTASAPQQGGGAAMAIGSAVIPYVLARTVASVNSASDRRKIVGLLEKAHGPLIEVAPPLGT